MKKIIVLGGVYFANYNYYYRANTLIENNIFTDITGGSAFYMQSYHNFFTFTRNTFENNQAGTSYPVIDINSYNSDYQTEFSLNEMTSNKGSFIVRFCFNSFSILID
jgi:hypothetical protein